MRKRRKVRGTIECDLVVQDHLERHRLQEWRMPPFESERFKQAAFLNPGEDLGSNASADVDAAGGKDVQARFPASAP